MEKEYTYEEFEQMPEIVKFWAKEISKEDGRSAHPEDYVEHANRLINKAMNIQLGGYSSREDDVKISKKYNHQEEARLFEMILALRKHTPCHRDFCYSFLDWFDYVVGR